MKRLAQKIIGMGADFSTKKALKTTLNFLGIEPKNVDSLYIELKNSFYHKQYSKIDPKDKVIMLPHCLRIASHCTAKITKYGYVCKGCSKSSKCKIYQIQELAKPKGYRVFITPGGSLALKILKKERPKAVLGIACLKELVLAAEEQSIPGQGIVLSKNGCVNTDVRMKDVLKRL